MTLFLAAKSSGNFAQQLVLLLPAGLERPPNSESIREQERSGLKMIAVIHGWYEEKQRWCRFPSRLPAFALPRQMHPKGSRFIGSSWVTQPFLLTRAILAKVELQQTVENIRHSVVLKGLLGFPPSGD